MKSPSFGRTTATLVSMEGDDVVSAASCEWAASRLAEALSAKGASVTCSVGDVGNTKDGIAIAMGGPQAFASWPLARTCGVSFPTQPESFAIVAPPADGSVLLFVFGADARGLVYGLTELTDRVRFADSLAGALKFDHPLFESPKTPLRSICRVFLSETEDKPWFYDREFWDAYLSMLVENRFNRFSLAFGFAYNYPYDNESITDVYLNFAYPFLVGVSGYDIRVAELDDTERDRNLEALQYIARSARERGLDFQLALWAHGYDFDDCPNANYRVVGVTPENHARYCRDALRMILDTCPEITGVTFRVHVESGIPEGGREFWKVLFEALASVGRQVEIDLHAKGVGQEMIDIALGTGQPVGISPKYLAEHMGLPYHPMAIRGAEMLHDRPVEGKWGLSEGSRRFLRYGYGDLLKQDRRFEITYRIWPGTQRILLSGDPAMAAAFGRSAVFGGARGIELCEPLSFKGRMGTGHTDGRYNYATANLRLRYDWEKYAYTYRLWGRLNCSPDADPDSWRRYLRAQFGPAAHACEIALGHASRILPLVTLTHAPSASNNTYWPELYWNMSIVDEAPSYPYGYDMARPARYGTVGAFDPQLFMSSAELAAILVSHAEISKYSPLAAAAWLDRLASTAEQQLAIAQNLLTLRNADFERLAIDVTVLSGLGRFFAAKNRAAVFWEIYLKTGEPIAAHAAVSHYRAARDAWHIAVMASKDTYLADQTYGPQPWLRGNWGDRLAAIEQDIALMVKLIKDHPLPSSVDEASAKSALDRLDVQSRPAVVPFQHEVPAMYHPGKPLTLRFASEIASRHPARLHYRHVNQAEGWQAIDMHEADGACIAAIPAGYLNGEYLLQYYFEFVNREACLLLPGMSEDLSGQPYFVVNSA